MPTNFIPLPNALVQPIVKALANIEGQRTLAARVHILGLVCRNPGWQGLQEDEFLLTPSELASVLDCDARYASRIMAALKAQGWMSPSGIPGMHRIEPEVVYETVADSVIRKKSEITNNRAHTGLKHPQTVVLNGSVDVKDGVGGVDSQLVTAAAVKPNVGEGLSASQESRIRESKSAIPFSLSSPSGNASAAADGFPLEVCEAAPARDEEALVRAAEVMAAYNVAAESLGIPHLSEADYQKLLPEILAVGANPGGYPFLPAIAGMRVVPAAWFAKFQPDYKFAYLLELKARQRWTEKLAPKPAASTTPTSSSKSMKDQPKTKGGGNTAPKPPLEERIGPHAVEEFRKLCLAWGNPDRVVWERDGETAARLVESGEVTWEQLCACADRKAASVSSPEMMCALSKWLGSRPWSVPVGRLTKRSGGNIRQVSDEAFLEAKAAAALRNETSPVEAVENPLARKARESQNALR